MLESEADYQRFQIQPENEKEKVEKSLVTDIVRQALEQVGEWLGNPKMGFLNWLDKLRELPGVLVTLPLETQEFLKSLPESSFNLPSSPLTCKFREKQQSSVFSSFLERASVSLDYDAMVKEAYSRFEKVSPADALKVLSCLVERNPGESVLARDVGFSAMEWGLYSQAYFLLKRVVEARPYEPQTYYALAQVLTQMDNKELASLYYEIALAGKWNARFQDFTTIVELDYLQLLRKKARSKGESPFFSFAQKRLHSLRSKTPHQNADVMVTIMWNTDNTDIDLHVVEPSGERCYYEHPPAPVVEASSLGM
jgi:tetratricopeptide (TPR) repeat protein